MRPVNIGNLTSACPNCGSDYLHHHAVTALERFEGREDGDGFAITVLGTQIGLVQKSDDDLPGRRNSIMVVFACEQCPELSVLIIEQHKGQTLVYWDD